MIGLAVLERARKRQSSRISNLKDGDANTRFFHLRINHRRRKNFIHRLRHNNGWVTSHDHKKSIIQNHFSEVTKRGQPRTTDINWDNIPVPACDLTDLGTAFSEKEVKKAIFDLPNDKAPGPDGYSGAFFKACWEIIKDDILLAVNHFSNLRSSNLSWLNSANIALIPKKDGAECISDFRPISLIHAVAKIIENDGKPAGPSHARPCLKCSKCLHQKEKHPRQLHVRQKLGKKVPSQPLPDAIVQA